MRNHEKPSRNKGELRFAVQAWCISCQIDSRFQETNSLGWAVSSSTHADGKSCGYVAVVGWISMNSIIFHWHFSDFSDFSHDFWIFFFSHSPTAQVGVDSFGLGILVGVFGTISTIAAVLQGNPARQGPVFFARWWWNTSILEDFGTSKWH